MRVALQTELTETAKGTPEHEWSVLQAKIALNRLGYYMPPKDTGITPDMEPDFTDALMAFQRIHMAPLGEVAEPGSVTERILNKQLARLDGNAFYTWRTVGDEKVRGDHALRAGRRFSWGDPPDGGHPGEGHNCRCWAEPLLLPQHPWIDWINERRRQREAHATILEKLQSPLGLNIDPFTQQPGLDAINPSFGPFDLIAASLIAKSPLSLILGLLKETYKARIAHQNKAFTGHGSARSFERKISEKDVTAAIRTAKKTGNFSTKIGKYGTPQIHYKGSNGITVIIETSGRNAGKVITTYRH